MKFFTLLMMLCITVTVSAQYQISGTVTEEESGELLPGATVQVNGGVYTTITNLDGVYHLNLKTGDYLISVSYVGFSSLEKEITLTKEMTLDFGLKESSYMADEVIVSAVRADQKTPFTYENITAKDLEVENLGRDIPYLIAMTPSTVVTSDAGTGIGYTGMRIRGSDQQSINITMNGVPLNDPESFGVYWVNMPDLASSISTMQIQRGVGTSTNGAGAFGASVNIETSKLSDEGFSKLSASGGSYNTIKGTAEFGTGLHNGFAMEGRLSTINSDGYVDRASADLKSAFLTGGYYGKSDILKFNFLTGKEITYQAWDGISQEMLDSDRTYNPEGEYEDEDGNIQYYDNQVDNYAQTHVQLFYSHAFNKKLDLTTTLHYTRGYGYYESYKSGQSYGDYGFDDPIIGNDTLTSTDLIRRKILDNHFYGAILSLNYNSFERLTLNYGLSYNKYDGDHYGNVIWANSGHMGMTDDKYYDNNGIKYDFNTFVKGSYLITNQFNAYLDLQFRHIDYKMSGTHDDLSDLTQEHTFDFFNPKAGLFYQLNDNQSAYVSFGVGHREPSRSNYRDADDSHPEPEAETLLDYELGYDFNSTALAFGANVYYMSYSDQLVMTGEINNVGDAIMQNVDASYRAGLELTAGWAITPIIRFDATTTFSQNKIKDFTEYVDNWDYWSGEGPYQYEKYLGDTDISFSPNITAMGMVTVKPFKDFSMSLSGNYVGKQYIDNTSSDARSLDDYLVTNFRCDYIFHPNWAKSIGIFAQLNNVLNQEYVTNAWVYRYVSGGEEDAMYGYYPQAEINFLVGLSLEF